MKLAAPATAVVRPVSNGYARCLRTDPEVPIDVATARRQHAAYVAALEEAGVEIVRLGAEEAGGPELPDACFIEDTAVIVGGDAVLTIPGAPTRQPEVAAVASALAGRCILHRMEGAQRLDGGDVLRVGSTLFVGLSARTNPAGAAFLAAVAARHDLDTCPLPLRQGLHLKSACTLVADGLVVADTAAPPELRAALGARGVAVLDVPEAHGANVLALGGCVLVSAAAPRSAALLRAHGLTVRSLDVSELHKGDGALTCLSLRIARPGSSCA